MVLVEMEYDDEMYQIMVSVGAIDPADLKVTLEEGRVRVFGQAFDQLNNGEPGVSATCDWSTKLSKLADGSQPWTTSIVPAPKGVGGHIYIKFPRKHA